MSRQTYSYLRSLFERHGVAPRRQFGQNFLIDLNLHEVIVQAGEVGPGDVVLEVGPGAGALTKRMLEAGASVVAVEIDPAMAELTRKAVDNHPGARVIQRDALAGKNRIAPEVLDQIRSGLAMGPDRRFKLVANLPYNIATPLISNLLVLPDMRPSLMVVTIQLELAQRMLAAPKTHDYSALSVLVQSLSRGELLRVLPPSVFWPRPKVDSAIIKIVPDDELREQVGDVAWFQRVVRQIFTLRRKNLRRVLHGFFREHLSKEQIDALLESMGLEREVRAEAMTPAQLLALVHALREALPQESRSTLPDSEDEGEPAAAEPEAEPEGDFEP